jgi:hypothetical protein
MSAPFTPRETRKTGASAIIPMIRKMSEIDPGPTIASQVLRKSAADSFIDAPIPRSLKIMTGLMKYVSSLHAKPFILKIICPIMLLLSRIRERIRPIVAVMTVQRKRMHATSERTGKRSISLSF